MSATDEAFSILQDISEGKADKASMDRIRDCLVRRRDEWLASSRHAPDLSLATIRELSDELLQRSLKGVVLIEFMDETSRNRISMLIKNNDLISAIGLMNYGAAVMSAQAVRGVQQGSGLYEG